METNESTNKSIDELAREAMEAIKKSEIKNKNKEERYFREEQLAKEQQLKNEAERRIKKKWYP